MKNSSYYIFKLISFSKYIGIKKVIINPFLPPEVGGRIYYKNRIIELNEPISINALMTLSHELGHWISYLMFFWRDSSVTQREIWANSIGYLIIKFIPVVSQERWLNYMNNK